jgi:hypothetical protein
MGGSMATKTRKRKKAKKKASKKRTRVLPVYRPTAQLVDIDTLKPHPRNYRKHTADQLEHLVESIRAHGLYKNVVAAKDWTILAGHGVVAAAKEIGFTKLPVVRLPIKPNDPRALKVLAGDNMIWHLAEDDDRVLTELLKELSSGDELLGTGFDDQMLAGLVMVTRPEGEIADKDEAAEWLGMPEYEGEAKRIQLVVAFDSEEERDELVEKLKVVIKKKHGLTWSTWWPPRERDDLTSVRFE